ncbi:MAG TPA: hypothetical protein VMV46_01610 [Thermoanaerobaculia bacterium]|nr:hypothetical protein [Thermoanaerobaculia bacterium]
MRGSLASVASFGRVLLLGALLSVPARSAPAQPPEADAHGGFGPARAEAMRAPLLSLGRDPQGVSAETVIRFFGRPFTFEVERRDAIHNELPNDHVVLRFPRAEAHVVVSLQNGRSFLEELTVRGADTLTRLGLAFGSTLEEVERTLGSAGRMGLDGGEHHHCWDAGCDILTVAFEGETVSRVTWDWWID